MFCEAYNQSLKDAAAGGEALSPSLQQHLVSCASCHAAFAEEKSLFAAIDASLQIAANSEIPATLIPRVRVALNNEPVPQRRGFSFLAWGATAAAVTATIVFALVYLSSNQKPLPIESAPSVAVTTTQNPANRPALNSARAGGVFPVQRKNSAVLVVNHNAKPDLPEVLVPDEERVAFAQFMANASSSSGSGSARAALAPRAPQESVRISPVEIASLELRPLDEKEGRQGQF